MKRMREISIACIALMLLLTAVTIPYALAHTCGTPLIANLIAGGGNPNSARDAGDVHVWNDGDLLYVKYVPSCSWCLNETHLHVASSLGDIPQTKKGNPIPGKFDYKNEHVCVLGEPYTYTIALNGWTLGTELHIAAHAVVCTRINCECECETAWGDGDGFDFPGKNWATGFNYTVQ